MSRLEEIKEACAKDFEFADWNDLRSFHILQDVPGLEEIENDVIAQYVEECCKASLEKAYFNHEIFTRNGHDEEIIELNKESITNPENIVIL